MSQARRRERLQHFKELCRQRRLSLTVQRRVIFEAILDRRDHPTADQVYDQVKDRIPGVSRTTVYRVLETLVEMGAVTKACSPGAATRFDPMTHRHHHLFCVKCDKLIDLEDDHLNAVIKLSDVQTRLFQITDYSVHFRGVCAACRKRMVRGGTTPLRTGVRIERTSAKRVKTRHNRKRRTKP